MHLTRSHVPLHKQMNETKPNHKNRKTIHINKMYTKKKKVHNKLMGNGGGVRTVMVVLL